MRGMETNPESRIARLPSFSSLSRRARISGQNFGDRDTGNIIWTDGLLILGMRRILYSITRRPIHIAEGYIEHLVCATNCAAATYLVMMEYVRRATCAARQLGMIDVCDDWEGLLVTGLVLAGKFLDDEVFTNGYYADVGNVPLSVINHLEVRMLGLLDWNLCMSIPRFAECEREMASACVWR